MIKKFKCWFFGHNWQQKGQSPKFYKDYDERHLYTTLNFLFFCPTCSTFKEYETKCFYENTPAHEEEEVEIEE